VVVALARAILFISVVIAVARAKYREPMECKGYKVNQRVLNIIIVTPLLTFVIALVRAQYQESVKRKGKERVKSIQKSKQSTQRRETGHNRQQVKEIRENSSQGGDEESLHLLFVDFFLCFIFFFVCTPEWT
jgi:Flp pilus assembly protein TadB